MLWGHHRVYQINRYRIHLNPRSLLRAVFVVPVYHIVVALGLRLCRRRGRSVPRRCRFGQEIGGTAREVSRLFPCPVVVSPWKALAFLAGGLAIACGMLGACGRGERGARMGGCARHPCWCGKVDGDFGVLFMILRRSAAEKLSLRGTTWNKDGQ